jgi:hypothetical protein
VIFLAARSIRTRATVRSGASGGKGVGSVYASELSRAYVHIRIGGCALSSYSHVFTSEAAVVWVVIVRARVAPVDVIAVQKRGLAMKIKIEVLERAGWWQVKICGLRHSRYQSQAAAKHGAKLLAARVQKLRVQARSRRGRMQLGQRLRVAHCELYCIRTLLRGRR